jgi:hypothetical protein
MLNTTHPNKIGITYYGGHFPGDTPPPDGNEVARGSYIVFIDHDIPKGMKTHVFSVWTLTNDWIGVKLGEVRWYGAWRKYDFSPAAGTRFEEVCMGEISEFIVSQTKAHKEKAKKNVVV